jgi:hypothetical protein
MDFDDRLEANDDQSVGEFSSGNKTINICDTYEVIALGYKNALKYYIELFGSEGMV